MHGAGAQIAKNGQECVQLAEQQDFDVVLMDCQMPGMRDPHVSIASCGADVASQ